MRVLATALILMLAIASVASAGVLDTTWIAPTTNADGTPLRDLKGYKIYYVVDPGIPCPGTQFFTLPSPTTSPAPNIVVNYQLTGLVTGVLYQVSVTAVDTAGNESACIPQSSAIAKADPIPPPPPPIVTFGETAVVTSPDNSNGNLLLVQQATLATPGTLLSISFYVGPVTAGNLRLGIYSNVSGIPSTKIAETIAFVPVVGWNTISVTQPITLQPGTYWLAYLPSSNTLAFPVDRTSGTHKLVPFTFGVMPATFPTSGVQTAVGHWSFYGTVTTLGGAPGPATNIQLRFEP